MVKISDIVSNVTDQMGAWAQKVEDSRTSTGFEKNKMYSYLGKDLVKALKDSNAIVAGGMITSLFTNSEINDVDVYFRSKEDIASFVESIWSSHVVSHTKKATMFGYGGGKDAEPTLVQTIHFKYFDSPEDVFDTFDFIHVMGAYDFTTEEFVLHKDFLKYNAQKVLKFHKDTAFPLVSLIRVGKYEDRGYSVSKPEMMRIAMTCMNLEINSYEELADHLGGMYGVAYENMLEEIEDEEFSLDGAIDKLENLSLREDYFKKPKSIEFNSLDDLVDSICGVTPKFFKLNDSRYRIRYDGSFGETSYCNSIPKHAEEVDVSDYLDVGKVYKYVKPKDGHLVSYFKNSFRYDVGNEVTPEGNHGLYFNRWEDIDKSTYADKSDKVLIEANVDVKDLLSVRNSDLVYSKATITRVVEDDETGDAEDLIIDVPF